MVEHRQVPTCKFRGSPSLLIPTCEICASSISADEVGSAFSLARKQKKSFGSGSPTIKSIHLFPLAAITRYGKPGPAQWAAR